MKSGLVSETSKLDKVCPSVRTALQTLSLKYLKEDRVESI